MKVTFESSNQKEPEVIIKGDITNPEVESLLHYLSHNETASNKLFLYKDDEQFIVDVKEIIYFEACNNKVRAVTVNGDYDTKSKLYELINKVGALHFAQINKSTLVNIDFVKSVQAEFSGNYTVKLKNKKEILIISRKYFKEFKSKI